MPTPTLEQVIALRVCLNTTYPRPYDEAFHRAQELLEGITTDSKEHRILAGHLLYIIAACLTGPMPPEGALRALTILGNRQIPTGPKTTKDECRKLSFLYIKMAVDLGDVRAMKLLSICYSEGCGIPVNLKEAARLQEILETHHAEELKLIVGEQTAACKLFAKNGDRDAELIISHYCYEGTHGFSEDPVEGLRLLMSSAAKGTSRAQYTLGMRYFYGTGGVKRDLEEAIRLWTLSAEQNFASAKHSLGLLYIDGNGVERDQKRGFRLINEASEKCLESRMLKAICYDAGYGVKQDFAESGKVALSAYDAGARQPGLQKLLNSGKEPDVVLAYILHEVQDRLSSYTLSKKDQDKINKNFNQTGIRDAIIEHPDVRESFITGWVITIQQGASQASPAAVERAGAAAAAPDDAGEGTPLLPREKGGKNKESLRKAWEKAKGKDPLPDSHIDTIKKYQQLTNERDSR